MQSFENLCRWFESLDGVMVAVSGGVDSALVAAAAYKTLGSAAIAVTADYKTLSKDELDSAKSICKQIGIRHTMLNYDELQNPQFVANDKTRCYHCRTELSGHLLTLASELGISTIVDGTNTDDFDYPIIYAREEKWTATLCEIFQKSVLRVPARAYEALMRSTTSYANTFKILCSTCHGHYAILMKLELWGR